MGPTTQLLDHLGALRQTCQVAETSTLAQGKDQVKLWCTRLAWRLMRKFSTREPVSKTAKDPFRVITGLIYEVLTGEQGRDLERPCNDLLATYRAAPRDNSQAK